MRKIIITLILAILITPLILAEITPPENPSAQINTKLDAIQNSLTETRNQLALMKNKINDDMNTLTTKADTEKKFNELNEKIDKKVGLTELVAVSLATAAITACFFMLLKGMGRW